MIDPAGVEQHHPVADLLEPVLDDEAVEAAVVGKHGLQELAQPRDVPLAVAELVDEAPPGLVGVHGELRIEGLVGGIHPQVPAENQQGVARGVEDLLGQLLLPFELEAQALRFGGVLEAEQKVAAAIGELRRAGAGQQDPVAEALEGVVDAELAAFAPRARERPRAFAEAAQWPSGRSRSRRACGLRRAPAWPRTPRRTRHWPPRPSGRRQAPGVAGKPLGRSPGRPRSPPPYLRPPRRHRTDPLEAGRGWTACAASTALRYSRVTLRWLGEKINQSGMKKHEREAVSRRLPKPPRGPAPVGRSRPAAPVRRRFSTPPPRRGRRPRTTAASLPRRRRRRPPAASAPPGRWPRRGRPASPGWSASPAGWAGCR